MRHRAPPGTDIGALISAKAVPAARAAQRVAMDRFATKVPAKVTRQGAHVLPPALSLRGQTTPATARPAYGHRRLTLVGPWRLLAPRLRGTAASSRGPRLCTHGR